MKILTIRDEQDFDVGSYSPACEGFLDALKSIFKKKDSGPYSDNLKAVKGTGTYSVIRNELEKNLKETYDNPEWVRNNLPEDSIKIVVKEMAYANIDGKPVYNAAPLVKVMESMLSITKQAYGTEKPFIELRKKLIKDIADKSDAKYADEVWVKYAKELTPFASQRFIAKHKNHIPAIGNSPEKDGEWPVSAKKRYASGFNNAFPTFQTDGTFESPSQRNAKEYANAIRFFVNVLEETRKLTDESMLSHWEFLNVEYDDLKYDNLIYDRISSSDNVYEICDVFNGLYEVCYSLIRGLYIVMFDKHKTK